VLDGRGSRLELLRAASAERRWRVQLACDAIALWLGHLEIFRGSGLPWRDASGEQLLSGLVGFGVGPHGLPELVARTLGRSSSKSFQSRASRGVQQGSIRQGDVEVPKTVTVTQTTRRRARWRQGGRGWEALGPVPRLAAAFTRAASAASCFLLNGGPSARRARVGPRARYGFGPGAGRVWVRRGGLVDLGEAGRAIAFFPALARTGVRGCPEDDDPLIGVRTMLPSAAPCFRVLRRQELAPESACAGQSPSAWIGGRALRPIKRAWRERLRPSMDGFMSIPGPAAGSAITGVSAVDLRRAMRTRGMPDD